LLSYQHAFHAGNHADLIKHITLIALLEKLQQKPKPFFYLDTHAGSGAYDTQTTLNKDPLMAAELCDFLNKIASADTLKNTLNPLIKRYQDIVSPYLAKDLYPGSPLVAFEQLVLSEHLPHKLHLSEMHPSAFEGLRTWTRSSDFQLHKRDGFELLGALTPPKPNRGLVLIDPPYEQASEYSQVVASVVSAAKKWPQGIFAIWFPLLSSKRIDRNTGEIANNPKSGMSENMLTQLSEFAKKQNLGLLELRFVPQLQSEKVGMYGSGIAVLNPPWQFAEQMKTLVESLVNDYLLVQNNQLSKHDKQALSDASYVKQWQVSE